MYRRLQNVGFKRNYVRDYILPDWWDDEITTSQSGQIEMGTHIARSLSLDFNQVMDLSATLTIPGQHCLFKSRENADCGKYSATVAICRQAASLASICSSKSYEPISQTGAQIRDEIIASTGRPVDLRGLVNWCWKRGIPVLHVGHFPTNKPDGMVLLVGGRPVIVVCRNESFHAKLLFVIAHELGHILRNHLQPGNVLIDAHVSTADTDEFEVEANETAIEILTGSGEVRFTCSGNWPSAALLAKAAKRAGEEMQIDPGHVILNYQYGMGNDFQAIAIAALKKIERNKTDATQVVRDAMAAKLDWEKIPEESAALLSRLTKVNAGSSR